MTVPPEKVELVNVVWTEQEGKLQQGYTSFGWRIFRLFYSEETQLLSIYPCDQDGAPVSLYLFGSKVGNFDVVLSRIVDVLNRESVEDFLSWSFKVFADLGVLPIRIGDLVNVLYTQLSEMYDKDQAAVMTSSIVTDMVNQNIAEG